jgi:hypothetical protein
MRIGKVICEVDIAGENMFVRRDTIYIEGTTNNNVLVDTQKRIIVAHNTERFPAKHLILDWIDDGLGAIVLASEDKLDQTMQVPSLVKCRCARKKLLEGVKCRGKLIGHGAMKEVGAEARAPGLTIFRD